MLLYIIRHAWAGAPDESQWPDDRERPLTEEGRERFAEMVRKLAKRGFAPGIVASSPLVRCLETARIVSEGVRGRPKVIERHELAPDSDLKGLLAWMQNQAGQHEEVAWVGHVPDVGQIAAALIGMGSASIDFSKGTVAAIEFESSPSPGAGTLIWLVTAKLLNC